MLSLISNFRSNFALAIFSFALLILPADAADGTKQFANTETDKRFSLTKEFDIKAISARMSKTSNPKMHFKKGEKVQVWADRTRKELKKLLGVSDKKTDLKPVTKDEGKFTVETSDGKQFTYTREAVQYISRDGFPIFGYFLLPANAKGKLPCIICIPGHGRSVDDIAGINIDGSTRKKFSIDYQYDIAIQCVTRGFAVLAIEALGSGRLQSSNQRQRVDECGLERQCRQLSAIALAHGKTLLGWNVNSAMSAVDYLQTRREIAPDRIGIAGVSRGAAVALFSAAVDPRIKCSLVSCYLSDWQQSILPINHCICNYIPNVLAYVKVSDVAGLVAPRYLFCEGSTDDRIFPYKGAMEAFGEVREIYKSYGCEDRIFYSTGKTAHCFRGNECLPKMSKHL